MNKKYMDKTLTSQSQTKKKINFIYLASIRYPNEKAHGIQIAQMCSAFARMCFLILMVPNRTDRLMLSDKQIEDRYQIANNFEVKYLPIINSIEHNITLPKIFHNLAYLISQTSFFISSLLALSHKTNKIIIYTRDINLSVIGLLLHKPVFVELHHFPSNKLVLYFYRHICPKIDGFIVIHPLLKTKLLSIGVREENIMTAPSGIADFFLNKNNAVAVREQYKIPKSNYIVTYCGSLQKGKGVEALLEAAKVLTLNKEILFLIVGGKINSNEYTLLQQKTKEIHNLRLISQQPYKDISKILQMSDLLIVPNTTDTVIYSQYTSPMKLYEYMSAQKPVLCADVPALKNISPENTYVTYFDHLDINDLVNKILVIKSHPPKEKINLAYTFVQSLTWQKRAEKIIRFIKNRIS